MADDERPPRVGSADGPAVTDGSGGAPAIDDRRWIGLRTLFRREVLRYVRRPRNTFLPPLITNALFFAVFGVILGERIGQVAGVSYVQFVLPGLVVLGGVSDAFENASFSIFHGRWNEYIHEVLTAPLSYREMVVAYVGASVLRGILSGVLITAVGVAFVAATEPTAAIPIAHPVYLLGFAIVIGTLFAGIGVIGGLWARDFDYLTVMNQFLLRPLVFFGGVFYSLDTLPPLFRTITLLNPLVYMVNGIRFGMLGISEVDPAVSLAVIAAAALVVVAVDIELVRRGYGLTE
jgi:ABC-2 type transport system permease protein